MERHLKGRLKVFISCSRGAGSILDIAPTTRWEHLVPRKSVNERLQADFWSVGGALRHGVDTVKGETPRYGARRPSRLAG